MGAPPISEGSKEQSPSPCSIAFTVFKSLERGNVFLKTDSSRKFPAKVCNIFLTYGTTLYIGNLGADPEVRYTPSGKAVANFVIRTPFLGAGVYVISPCV